MNAGEFRCTEAGNGGRESTGNTDKTLGSSVLPVVSRAHCSSWSIALAASLLTPAIGGPNVSQPNVSQPMEPARAATRHEPGAVRNGLSASQTGSLWTCPQKTPETDLPAQFPSARSYHPGWVRRTREHRGDRHVQLGPRDAIGSITMTAGEARLLNAESLSPSERQHEKSPREGQDPCRRLGSWIDNVGRGAEIYDLVQTRCIEGKGVVQVKGRAGT